MKTGPAPTSCGSEFQVFFWLVSLGRLFAFVFVTKPVVTGNHTGLRLTSFSCPRTSRLISLLLHNAFLVCRRQGGHHLTPRGFCHSKQLLGGRRGVVVCSMLISAFRNLFDFSHPRQVTPCGLPWHLANGLLFCL